MTSLTYILSYTKHVHTTTVWDGYRSYSHSTDRKVFKTNQHTNHLRPREMASPARGGFGGWWSAIRTQAFGLWGR